MRLLDTHARQLVEFNDFECPHYAILSHTWQNDEFLFSDFAKPDRRQSEGWTKISRCCELAASEGWHYVWIDTCCIDKSSSAELTESINSMYQWYAKSKVCYVYLEDYRLPTLGAVERVKPLRESRWFTRGWTLQELLAPQFVRFYDTDWVEIGSRDSLRAGLGGICGISEYHLGNPKEASIATKMSWASCRRTSRKEDKAYSLLGLFNVHMPLIYGEGNNAFLRLQLAIMESSDDESLFAWEDSGLDSSGLLARSPKAFRYSVDVVPSWKSSLQRSPYHMTNKGLEFQLHAYPTSFELAPGESQIWAAPLNCTRAPATPQSLTIFIQKTGVGRQLPRRVLPHRLVGMNDVDIQKGGMKKTMTVHIPNAWDVRNIQLRESWLPAKFNFMTRAQERFRIFQEESGFHRIADRGELGRQPESFLSNSPYHEIRELGITNSQGIHFCLGRLGDHAGPAFLKAVRPGQDQDHYSYHIPEKQVGSAWTLVKWGGSLLVEMEELSLGYNKTFPLGGNESLWITTRRTYVRDSSQMVVDIDVTMTDRTNLFDK